MYSSWKCSGIKFITGRLSSWAFFCPLKNISLNRDADLIVAQSVVTNFVETRLLLPLISREIKLKYGT